MKTETAIQILKEALHIAISKGCYGLVETTNIVKAIEILDIQPSEPIEEFSEITED